MVLRRYAEVTKYSPVKLPPPRRGVTGYGVVSSGCLLLFHVHVAVRYVCVDVCVDVCVRERVGGSLHCSVQTPPKKKGEISLHAEFGFLCRYTIFEELAP
jgi:hypothetical protein